MSGHIQLLESIQAVILHSLRCFPPPSGLSKAPDHIHQAMAFAKELIKAAETIEMAGGLRIALSIGLHTGSAQVG